MMLERPRSVMDTPPPDILAKEITMQGIENKGLPVQKVRKSPQRNENEGVRWTLEEEILGRRRTHRRVGEID